MSGVNPVDPVALLRFRRSAINLASGPDAREVSANAKGGRVGVTTEMEIDVMKGLVLAQHQRIERQRLKMQELERDLRWVPGSLKAKLA